MNAITIAYFNPCIYAVFNHAYGDYHNLIDPEQATQAQINKFSDSMNDNVLKVQFSDKPVPADMDQMRIVSPFHCFDIVDSYPMPTADAHFKLTMLDPTVSNPGNYKYSITGTDTTNCPISRDEIIGSVPFNDLPFKLNSNQYDALTDSYAIVNGTLDIIEKARRLNCKSITISTNRLHPDYKNQMPVSNQLMDIYLNTMTNSDDLEDYLLGLYRLPAILAETYGIKITWIRN